MDPFLSRCAVRILKYVGGSQPSRPTEGMRYLFYSVCIYLRYLINLISTIPIHQNTLPLGADCSGLGGAFSVSCDNAVAESASWQDLSTDKGLCHFFPPWLALCSLPFLACHPSVLFGLNISSLFRALSSVEFWVHLVFEGQSAAR